MANNGIGDPGCEPAHVAISGARREVYRGCPKVIEEPSNCSLGFGGYAEPRQNLIEIAAPHARPEIVLLAVVIILRFVLGLFVFWRFGGLVGFWSLFWVPLKVFCVFLRRDWITRVAPKSNWSRIIMGARSGLDLMAAGAR